MRLLLDENCPKPIVDLLKAQGHDVVWALEQCQGWKDTQLLELAESEARILLTLDKDFWQLAVQRRVPIRNSGVVLFRVHPSTVENLSPLIRAFSQFENEWAGSISIVTADRVQVLRGAGR